MAGAGSGDPAMAALCAGLAEVVASASQGCASRSRAGWQALVGQCQAAINTLTAAQDAAIVRLVAIEDDWDEDGTLSERVIGLGRAVLDGEDLVAHALTATRAFAAHRVDAALAIAGDRFTLHEDSWEDPPGGLPDEPVLGAPPQPACTGLGGLRAAQAAGTLDGYRASVVAQELAEVPPDVAAAVVAAISEYFPGETAPQLRRRVRRLLASISPEFVRQRATRERARVGVTRRAVGDGVDEWIGRFPCEDALVAWQAVDALAHAYLADKVCPTIEAARGKALTDLVCGNATIDVSLALGVPATVLDPDTPDTPDDPGDPDTGDTGGMGGGGDDHTPGDDIPSDDDTDEPRADHPGCDDTHGPDDDGPSGHGLGGHAPDGRGDGPGGAGRPDAPGRGTDNVDDHDAGTPDTGSRDTDTDSDDTDTDTDTDDDSGDDSDGDTDDESDDRRHPR
ncbi:MAG: hypothetical protein V9G19_10035 [Tetrasphaera sp.]